MKKAVSVFLAILCALSVFTLGAFAEGENQFPTSGEIGDQGDNVVWQFDAATGKLTVSGTGKMREDDKVVCPFSTYIQQKTKELEVAAGVTHICKNAFFDFDNLRKVTLHEGLMSIGAYAFYTNRSLATFTVPASVTEIGQQAFNHCIGMEKFIVSEGSNSFCARDGVLYTKDMTELVAYCAGNRRTSYTVPDGVKRLRHASFRKAANLLKISLPDSLDVIEGSVFLDCFLLREIRMPKTLRELGDSAFADCPVLTSIEIPEGVKTIYTNTFSLDSLLRTIHIPHSVTKIEASAFYGCDIINEIYYNGTAAEWDALHIEGQPICFYTAKMHFNDTQDTGFLARIQSTIRNLFNMIRRIFEAMFSFAG